MNEIRLRTTGAVVTEADFRNNVHPNKMLPAILTKEMLESLAADMVLPAPQPNPGRHQIVVRVGVEQDALGNWVQLWGLQDIPADQVALQDAMIRASKWEAIKAERDGPRVAGGVKVGGAWFHSDDASRIKWLALKDSGRDILAAGGSLSDPIIENGEQVHWKTMSGTFAPVTVQLAFDVVKADKTLDVRLFKQAEYHRAMLNACDSPETYDYLTGWPERYSA